MKAILEIPADLYRKAKVRAAEKHLPLQRFVTQAIRREIQVGKENSPLFKTVQSEYADWKKKDTKFRLMMSRRVKGSGSAVALLSKMRR